MEDINKIFNFKQIDSVLKYLNRIQYPQQHLKIK